MNDDFLREGLTELYEQAPCGYILTLPDGTLIRVNKTFLAWTGYTQDELVSQMRLQQLLSVPGRIFYETRYGPLLRMQGFVNEVAFDIVRKDQSRLPVLVNSVQRVDDDGEIRMVASIIFDATQRRQYEQELLLSRQRAERLAAIVTQSGDAIMSVSPDGAVESWNGAAERLFGLEGSTGSGHHLRELLLLSDDEHDYQGILATLRDGRTVQLETQARHSDGHLVDVSVGMTPHLGLLGELSQFSLILRDITERRSIERMKDELVAIVSHDLRSPLAFILGVTELLATREIAPDKQQHFLQTMLDEGRRLAALVDDFLDIQRMESGTMRVDPVPLDPWPVLERAVQTVGADSDRPIILDSTDVPPVLCDEAHLHQIVKNLLSNARKYSPNGGEIRVSARTVGASVEISVQDRGLGIPPEALPQLFQKFYRVQTADRQNISGTGLGLAICQRIVEAYGGSIRVASAGPNCGSTFTFSLPIATTQE